jgi:hypothetical protein
LALVASPSEAAGPWKTAEIVAEAIDLFDRPSDSAFSTGRLARGTKVRVVRDEGDWLAVAAPPGSFSWIESDSIVEEENGAARVVADGAKVRPGADGARLPGAPRTTLRRDAAVRLVDRPDLTLRQGDTTLRLRAIVPPVQEARFLRAEGVRILDEPAPSVAESDALIRPVARPAAVRMTIDRSFLSVGPRIPSGALPDELAANLARVERAHAATLARPIDQWNFDGVRRGYRDLSAASNQPAARAAVAARLRQVERQESASKAAKKFDDALRSSRARDRDLAVLRSKIGRLEQSRPRPFDAEGLLQVSSKQVDGEALFGLIGSSGEATAYVAFPAGLDGSKFMGRRVGIRGQSRYNESLRARLINAQDLEPLGAAP